jgi:hypothetical protein
METCAKAATLPASGLGGMKSFFFQKKCFEKFSTFVVLLGKYSGYDG